MFKNYMKEAIPETVEIGHHHDCFYACLFNTCYIDEDFSRASFDNCDLSGIRFIRCNFAGADFLDCDLKETEFNGCDLYNCNFRRCKGNLLEYRTGKILTEDLIGYKKCASSRYGCGNRIVKLKIPRGAIVFSINGHKCRTNMVEILDIYSVYDGSHRDVAYAMYKELSYYVGDKITVYDFNCEYNVECGEGIHFFMDEQSAINYGN